VTCRALRDHGCCERQQRWLCCSLLQPRGILLRRAIGRSQWAWPPVSQSVEIIVIDFTLPTAFMVFCIETNDFALSGVVPMVARRVVTTQVFTRSFFERLRTWWSGGVGGRIFGLREMLAITKSLQYEESSRVAQRPPGPSCRSTIEMEILLFDSERQLCHPLGLYCNRRSSRAHSIYHLLGHYTFVNIVRLPTASASALCFRPHDISGEFATTVRGNGIKLRDCPPSTKYTPPIAQ
jgi:hypothetical protein